MEQKVTLDDLKKVLEIMIKYNKSDGFIAFVPGESKLRFFNSEPSFGGAYITTGDIVNYINNY